MKRQLLDMQSLCVHEFEDTRTTRPHQLPIYASASFEFDTIEQGIDIFKGHKEGHVYARYGNPTSDTVAEKLAALETYGSTLNAYAFLTSSGMSAISTALITMLSAGDKVLTQGNLYGGTTELLIKVLQPKGITPIFTNLLDLDNVRDHLNNHPEIKLIYFETPANPTMDCVDISEITKLARNAGIRTMIDNTFCTPYLQQPLTLGVDIVIHSTTKFLNGHGNSISGAIIAHDMDLKRPIWQTLKLAGTNSNPWDAWLLNNGLKTLALRMDRHSENAMKLANHLQEHSKVSHVNYCGLENHRSHKIAAKQMRQYGAMLSFELDGDADRALSFLNNLKMCTLAPTLGDVDTLMLHPATSSHLNVDPELRRRNGITDGLIRISVGIEKIDDIVNDIEQALA